MKLRPLNVFSWKFAEQLAEHRDVHVDAAAIIFGAQFECVVDLRLELEIAARRRALAIRLSRSTQIAPPEMSADRRRRWRNASALQLRHSAERSRLNPPAL